MTARTRRLLLATVAAISVCLAGTAAAHSGLGAASPAPGATVGGEVAEIQLRYSSSVSDVEGSVTDPDGQTLETVVTQESVLAVRIALAEPLTVPGEYTVRHVSTSDDDGDRVEAAYLFTFDPSAPPPQLEILDVDDEGTSIWVWIVLSAGLVVIGVLAWRVVRAAKRLNSARAAT